MILRENVQIKVNFFMGICIEKVYKKDYNVIEKGLKSDKQAEC